MLWSYIYSNIVKKKYRDILQRKEHAQERAHQQCIFSIPLSYAVDLSLPLFPSCTPRPLSLTLILQHTAATHYSSRRACSFHSQSLSLSLYLFVSLSRPNCAQVCRKIFCAGVAVACIFSDRGREGQKERVRVRMSVKAGV